MTCRPRRSGAPRRAQALRAEARMITRLLKCFAELQHRGCTQSALGNALQHALSMPSAASVAAAAATAPPKPPGIFFHGADGADVIDEAPATTAYAQPTYATQTYAAPATTAYAQPAYAAQTYAAPATTAYAQQTYAQPTYAAQTYAQPSYSQVLPSSNSMIAYPAATVGGPFEFTAGPAVAAPVAAALGAAAPVVKKKLAAKKTGCCR